MNIADIAINSMDNTLAQARSYTSFISLNTESIRQFLLDRLNEASGKCMVVCEILDKMEQLEEENKVLNHFNEKIVPEFAKIIGKYCN